MLNATKFESFSQSANLGLTDVTKIANADLLNTVTNQLQTASASMKEMASGLIQGVLPFDSAEAQSVLDSGIRTVRDTFSTLQNITGINQSQIEAEIASVLPGGSVMQKAFKDLSATCRQNGLSKMPGFKPYPDKMGCGSPGNGACGTGEVSGFLGKLTGGAIGAIGTAIQSILRSLTALANIGYSGGLCKIFSALTNALGASPAVVQRGAAGLLATVGLAGNMTAVMDIAGNMGDAIPSAEVPGLVSMISGNFTAPGDFVNGKMGALYGASMDAFSLIQPGFDKASDGIYSLANMSHNDAFGQTAQAFLNEGTFTDLTTPVYEEGKEMAVAYLGDKMNDAFSGLGSFFG